MLQIYADLFRLLNNSSIKYLVYKGLNHLEQDLDGNRGDIDLLVTDSSYKEFLDIIGGLGYSKVKSFGFSEYFYALDLTTGKSSLLDVVRYVPLGMKPYKYLALNIDELIIDADRAVTINLNGISVLVEGEQLKLDLISKIFSKHLSEEDISNFLSTYDSQSKSYLDSFLLDIYGRNFESMIVSGGVVRFYDDLNLSACNKILKNNRVYLSGKLNLPLRIINKLKRMFGVPDYRIRRKGRLFALVGVDGAGKTSVVERLNKTTYFKSLGIKTIYFGNNDYWMPGLNRLAKYEMPVIGKRVVSVFTRIDRQLRVVIAKYYIMLGRDVVADRYYYDDLYTQLSNKLTSTGFLNQLINLLKKLVSVKMVVIPDKTFFLNVSPDVSYARKQDYCYEKLCKTIDGYRSLMIGRPEVFVVDANMSEGDVFKVIVSEIKCGLDE